MKPRTLTGRRAIVAVVAAAAVIGGTGAALATTTGTFDPKAEHDAFQAAVAKHLGVTTKQLQDAYKAAALDRLDAAVAAGRITKEQAAEIEKRIESGDFPGPMGFGLFGHGMHGPDGDRLGAAADYLGLTEAQLLEKLRAGKSLAGVAKEQGKSVDGLKNAMLSDAKAKLDQAVQDGRITAAQRDEMLKRLEAMLDEVVNRTGPQMHDMPFRERYGSGGMGPGWMGPGFGGAPAFGFHGAHHA